MPDKSTDGTKSILKKYSKKYSNIKTIFLDKNHGNPGIPRNIGIKNATSEHIMFIDDDDEYFPEICEKLYNTLILENADTVVCNNQLTDNNNITSHQIDSKEVIYNDEIIYFNSPSVWNRIFKKSIILDNNISFHSINAGEDAVFVLNYAMHSKKLVYLTDFIGYNYVLRKDSLSLYSFDFTNNVIKSFDFMAKLLESNENKYDLNRFFKKYIPDTIWSVINLNNKYEIKEMLYKLSNFEKRINFTAKLPIMFQFINFFISRGYLSIATYICLFLQKIRKSNLLLKIYRKFFLEK